MISKYKNIILFIISGILSIRIGFFNISFIDKTDLYVKGIYYWLSISLILFVISVINFFKEHNFCFIKFLKKHYIAIILSIVMPTIGLFCCKPEFRIFADETNILSDSQNLYESKECFISSNTLTHLDKRKEIISKILEKRPALFQYLISLIHSLTGYNYQNAFIANYLCSILILFILYYIISLKFGRFWGILGLICIVSHPLYIWYTNSACFDIFNLLCSLIYIIILNFFIKTPNVINSELLLLFLPLLGQSRYESILAVFITLPLIFYLLPKTQYSKFSYRLWIFPFLLLPIAWLRNITNFVGKDDGMDFENPFALKYLFENFKQSIVFFFFNNKDFGTIPLISLIALIGFVIFIYDLKKHKTKKYKTICFSVLTFYLLHAIVKLSFCLGDFTEVLASRHALIFIPITIFMTIYCLNYLNSKYKLKKAWIITSIISLYLLYSSNSSLVYGIRDIPIYQEFKFINNYLSKNLKNKKEYIFVYIKPNYFAPFNYNVISYQAFNKINNYLKFYFMNNNTNYFLLFQIFSTKNNKSYDDLKLDKDYIVKPILERKIINNYYYKFSKVYLKID